MNKNWLFVLFAFCMTLARAQAESLVTTVFNVIESQKTETILVLSGADGRIYKAKKTKDMLKYLKTFEGKIVVIDYAITGNDNVISNLRLTRPNEVDENTMDLNRFRYNELRKFAPTDLKSTAQVEELFTDMLNDGDRRRSQCFKRAHMWAFDMWSKAGINSQKLFIFYTKRYIIYEDFEWWFHVAPLVKANGVEYVMDGTFMQKPITVKEWKDFFIKSEKVNCPIINDYKIYQDSQFTKLCFLMKVPMYYFSPLDIENRDLEGKKRNNWVIEELQDARRAFKNYSDVYEGLDTGKATQTF
jgi:Glutaminase